MLAFDKSIASSLEPVIIQFLDIKFVFNKNRLVAQLQALVSQLEAIAADEQRHKERSTGTMVRNMIAFSLFICLA
jgi:uncharacterized protein YbcI